jgi:hypothetical protein
MTKVEEAYERPYDPKQPVMWLDEKPIMVHAGVETKDGGSSWLL